MTASPDLLTAYLHFRSPRPDGSADTFHTVEVQAKRTAAPRSGQTRTGYGAAIPTSYMVHWCGKWRRVKCRIYSNNGTLHIGDPATCTVQIDTE